MTSNTPDPRPDSTGGRAPVPAWAPAAVCGAAVLGVFQFFGNAVHGYIDTASLFYWWGFQWVNPASEGEHGWLILALSAWLFWRNVREEKREGGKAENWKTGSALAAGLAVHALGFAAQQTRISIVGFLLCLWGTLRLAGGPRWGRAALLPVGFLLFAIPINVLDSLGFWLRVWVVNASAAIAHLAGIGVLRSGTQLVAPDGAYNYDVAAACSGIRSLTALAALTLLSGYLNFRSGWRRALVLALCLPLVYVGNVARIVAIVLGAQWGGPKWGHVAHEVMGYGVFAIVLGGVLGFIHLLQRRWPEAVSAVESGGPGAEPGAMALAPPADGGRKTWRLVAAVVALVAGEMVLLHWLAGLPPRGKTGVALASDGLNPVELPAFLGTEWIGQRAAVSATEREVLPPDTGFSRRNYAFLGDRRRDVFLSIVLSGRDRSSIHRPEICLVGQGWTILDTVPHGFRYPGRTDAAFGATLLRVRREIQTPRGKVTTPQLVAYWFVGGDTVVATHWQRMLRDAWNRVAHARADRWAYVLLQTDAADGEAAALARMQTVLDATLPVFQPPWSARASP